MITPDYQRFVFMQVVASDGERDKQGHLSFRSKIQYLYEFLQGSAGRKRSP